jgi:hypothetical protein
VTTKSVSTRDVDLVEGQQERRLVLLLRTNSLMLELKSLANPHLAENDYHTLLEQVAPGQTSIVAHVDPLSVVEVLLGHFAGVPEYREDTI